MSDDCLVSPVFFNGCFILFIEPGLLTLQFCAIYKHLIVISMRFRFGSGPWIRVAGLLRSVLTLLQHLGFVKEHGKLRKLLHIYGWNGASRSKRRRPGLIETDWEMQQLRCSFVCLFVHVLYTPFFEKKTRNKQKSNAHGDPALKRKLSERQRTYAKLLLSAYLKNSSSLKYISLYVW